MTRIARRLGAVGLLATLVLGGCSPTAPASGPLTTAVAESLSVTAPPASPTAEPFLSVPGVACCRGQDLPPGRYEAPPWVYVPVSLEVPEGWRVINESRALLFLLGRGENMLGNPSQMIVLLKTKGEDTPESITDGLRNVPQLTEAAPPTPVTVAGFDGIQLDMTALPNPAYEGNVEDDIPPGVQLLPSIERYLAEGFVWTTSTPEAEIRVIALNVGEQVLLVYLEAPPGDLDELAADADPILGSIELIE